MTSHVTDILYDYVMGDLSEPDRRRVEEHLTGCSSCSSDLETVRGAVGIVPRPAIPPSEDRDQTFWTAFVDQVERRIRPDTPAPSSTFSTVRDYVSSFVAFNRAPLLAGAGALALVAAMTLIWPSSTTRIEQPPPVVDRQTPTVTVEPAVARMNEYLKKSKVLFVGISNMKTDHRGSLDLTQERKRSRELVHEARYLKGQPLDARSARLVTDLERILIELANIEEHRDIPNVEIIRTGIRRENLLFKIRMAESMMETERIERTHQ